MKQLHLTMLSIALAVCAEGCRDRAPVARANGAATESSPRTELVAEPAPAGATPEAAAPRFDAHSTAAPWSLERALAALGHRVFDASPHELPAGQDARAAMSLDGPAATPDTAAPLSVHGLTMASRMPADLQAAPATAGAARRGGPGFSRSATPRYARENVGNERVASRINATPCWALDPTAKGSLRARVRLGPSGVVDASPVGAPSRTIPADVASCLVSRVRAAPFGGGSGDLPVVLSHFPAAS